MCTYICIYIYIYIHVYLPCQKNMELKHKQIKLSLNESKQTKDEHNNKNNDDSNMGLVLQGSLPII